MLLCHCNEGQGVYIELDRMEFWRMEGREGVLAVYLLDETSLNNLLISLQMGRLYFPERIKFT